MQKFIARAVCPAKKAIRFGIPNQPRRRIYGFVIGENAAGSGNYLPVGRAPMDFSKARIGQEVDTPYELTVDSGWVAIWQSAFFQHDRMFTSNPFAECLKLDAKLIPFAMMLFECASMSHVDEVLEVLELGFENAVYQRPAYAGDTFKKQFFVKDIRPSHSDPNKQTNKGTDTGTVVTLKCELSNQHGHTVFSVDKIMWYPYNSSASRSSSNSKAGDPLKTTSLEEEIKTDKNKNKRVLLRHIVDNVGSLRTSSSLAKIGPEQLILHTFNRPLGLQNSIDLNVLFRQGHPLLFNTARYTNEEIVLPGCLTFALATASASRALFEVLYEELVSCRFLEKVSPSKPLGAVSYIAEIRDLNGLEEITLVTLGLSDMDVHTELMDVDIPEEIFTKRMRMSELRAFIKERCPVLDGKLCLHSVRKLVRQAPFNQIQNIPLL